MTTRPNPDELLTDEGYLDDIRIRIACGLMERHGFERLDATVTAMARENRGLVDLDPAADKVASHCVGLSMALVRAMQKAGWVPKDEAK